MGNVQHNPGPNGKSYGDKGMNEAFKDMEGSRKWVTHSYDAGIERLKLMVTVNFRPVLATE